MKMQRIPLRISFAGESSQLWRLNFKSLQIVLNKIGSLISNSDTFKNKDINSNKHVSSK